MNNFRPILVVALIMISGATARAQFADRLGRAIQRSAEDATVRKSEEKTDQTVSTTIDKATDADTYRGKKEKGWTCTSCGTTGNTGKFCTSCGAKQPDDKGWKCTACGHKGNKGQFCAECGAKQSLAEEGSANSKPAKKPKQQNQNEATDEEEAGNDEPVSSGESAAESKPAAPKSAEMAYAKSDFMPGDEVIFECVTDNEQMGEFPSQWDLVEGTAEVAQANGQKGIFTELSGSYTVAPLMKNPKNYLSDVFTIEFDMWCETVEGMHAPHHYQLNFMQGEKEVITIYNTWSVLSWEYLAPGSTELRTGRTENVGLKENSWNHISISFNKRALKCYVNGVRLANIPNAQAPSHVTFQLAGMKRSAIRNVRIAQGAVPLYDRMMSDGKIISYGITFDVGKSTIKPESMTEINRIAQFMKDNPSIKFSVEGHTDNTGSAATNQALSEARSKAVMEKLVELGIDKNRLAAAGKGQNNPIADNSTDEGKAKNRRVEFVKL